MFIESFDKTKIWYDVKKNSDLCLLFIHGWANDWTTWEKEIDFFGKRGFSTITLDLRGHGQSDKPEGRNKYQLECFAKDIHEVIKKEKVKEFILVGHSMGGMIALNFYKLFNKDHKIKGMVLCDTTYRNVLEHKSIKILSPFIKLVLDFVISNEHINKKHFAHLKDVELNNYRSASDYFVFYEGLHNTPMKSVFSCLEAMICFDVKPVLKNISVPVLIIEGNKDKLLPKIDSIEMYCEIKGSEIDFVPKGRHFVNLENPELVDKYIFSFLDKHNLKPNLRRK